MIKTQGAQLLVMLLLIWTEGSQVKKTEGEDERKKYTLSEEKTARSALIGIKPEEVAMTGNIGDSGSRKNEVNLLDQLPAFQGDSGSRKSEVNLLDQLPAFQDEQRLTNSALDYSNHLSPLDQRLVKQFDKETVENHDDSSPGIMSKIEGAENNKDVNRNSRNFVEQVTRAGMPGRTEFNPERGLRQDISTLRNGGLDKDFYRQIGQIEGEQPQASDAIRLSDMYKSNPLPEYSYKESDYGEVSDNEGGYDKDYKSNPFEMPKNPFEMPKSPLEMPKNEYDLDTQDKELFQSYSNNQDQHASPSDNSDLYSMIGKKVVLDMLKQRNESQGQSYAENLKQNLLKKLLGGNSNQKDTSVDKLLVNKMTTTISPDPFIGHLPTVPSQGNVFTPGKITAKEALTLGAQQTTHALNLPKGINLSIQGHVFQGDPLAPSRMIKEQAPTARVPPSAAIELQNKLKNVELQSERTSLDNQLQSKEGNSNKENYVTLKISGAGKPVSFKAGTSNDGSLVLKIPGNVTLVDPATNKDISSQATLNENEKENFKTKMATDADQMNRYILETQTNPTEEFVKKGNLIEGHDDNPNKVMLSWQILGKTNAKLNQDEIEHSVSNAILQGNHKVISAVRPTSSRAFLPPTAIHDLSQIALTKYNELSRVSFAGVGKSPPSDLFPPSLKLGQNMENNKLLSLKSFLRPSKFIEDSPMSRERLSVRPVQFVPTNGILGQEQQRNSWSPCSVTCGQGIQARARLCEGTQCKGYRTESKACFMQMCPEQLGRAGLRLHNKFRAWHKSPPLKWSNRLAAKAQRIAKEMADKSIRLADLETENSGVNIAELWRSYDIAAEKATAEWYSEVKSYNFADPEISDSNRHFTQLIWKGSKEIGFGESKSTDGKHTFVVALYDPPGNIRNKEKSNVHLPESTT